MRIVERERSKKRGVECEQIDEFGRERGRSHCDDRRIRWVAEIELGRDMGMD